MKTRNGFVSNSSVSSFIICGVYLDSKEKLTNEIKKHLNEEDYAEFLELIEDELIMSLPIVPRHQVCQNLFLEDLAKEGQENPEFQRPNPFAVLANLKKSTKT